MTNSSPFFHRQFISALRLGLILSCFHFQCFGQQIKTLNRELQVESDNDAYTLNLTRDQYYSNGLYLRYRVLVDSSKRKSRAKKMIRSYDLNHRIFTPRHLQWTDSAQMDRPYAGQMSIAVAHHYFYSNDSYFKAKVELGLMGPSIRTGDLQYTWHKTFGMQLPMGWRYEISDAPIINAYGTYAKTLAQSELLDLTSETNAAVGTSFSHLRQEVMIRFGTIKPIVQSTQYDGVLGVENKGIANHEFYFFLSPGVEYIAYNATIEGNTIGKSSIYTEKRVPWVFQMRAGVKISWTKFDFALLYYRRTKETTEARFHKYMGIIMSQRF